MKISNAFSLSMLNGDTVCVFTWLSLKQVKLLVNLSPEGIESFVGHQPTADKFSDILGVQIPCIRGNLKFGRRGDNLLVGQYVGPRLEEGAKTLPAGADIKWCLVTIGSGI
jgi:hypothetical protein